MSCSSLCPPSCSLYFSIKYSILASLILPPLLFSVNSHHILSTSLFYTFLVSLYKIDIHFFPHLPSEYIYILSPFSLSPPPPSLPQEASEKSGGEYEERVGG